MFHTKMTDLACIGKRYKNAGLADIMIASNPESINGVMNGHHTNRSDERYLLCQELFTLQKITELTKLILRTINN